jgi:hypothetical protein
MGQSFSGNVAQCAIFPEKDKKVPRCRRQNLLLSGTNGPFERALRKSCHLLVIEK